MLYRRGIRRNRDGVRPQGRTINFFGAVWPQKVTGITMGE
jgi:hypothetical protein